MFDFPLPTPRVGLYEKLGVGPEATSEEIGDAKQELVNGLKSQKNSIDHRLNEVYGKIEGLRESVAKLRELTEGGSGVESSKLRAAQADVTRLESKAIQICPDYQSLRDESGQLDSSISDANRISLQNPDSRLAYDLSNPPFQLLKLVDIAGDGFRDNRVATSLVRREMTEFLEQAGEVVYQPSDLTRDDFTHDCMPNPILDGNM